MPDDDIIIITVPPKQQPKQEDQTDADRIRDLADAVERGDATVRFVS